jgi:nucleotide-binding universal stress UspA family protein
MKKFLVPCDFSKPAINAYRYALRIAAKSRGMIYLIYVVEIPVLNDMSLMSPITVEQKFMDDLKKKVEKSFSKLVGKYKTKGVKVQNDILFGSVIRMISDYVDEKEIDLVIMGSHGASGLKEFVVGSNSAKVVRTSPAPVLILKDLYDSEIRKIVFPYTPATNDQEEFVRKVINLQRFFKAHIDLVWINSPEVFHRDNDILKSMRSFAKRFRLKNFTIHVYNDLRELEGIINFTDAINADLIVMGTHGRRGLSHLFSGSITETVVNRVRWPIWTCVLK